MTPHEAATLRKAFVDAHVRDARRLGPIPPFGSDAWHRLPYASPLRWAAVLIAAEGAARDADNLEANLRAELDGTRRAAEADEAQQWAAMICRFQATAGGPTRVEILERRGEITPAEARELAHQWRLFTLGRRDTPPHIKQLRTGAA